MIESGYFASNTMIYVQLFAIQSAKEGQLNYIVVSDHEASAYLQIILNNNKEIESATVQQIFIPYSDWMISGGLAAQFEEWLLLPYQNGNNFLLALYHINNSQTVQKFGFQIAIINGLYGRARLFIRSIRPRLISILVVGKMRNLQSQSLRLEIILNYYLIKPMICNILKRSFQLLTTLKIRSLSIYTSILFIMPFLIKKLRVHKQINLRKNYDIFLQDKQNTLPNINSSITIEKSGPSPDPTPDPIPIPDTSSDIYVWIIALIAIGSITIIGGIIVIYMKYKQIGWFKVHINGYQENVEI